MLKSEQINELVGALAEAQAGLTAAKRNRSVTVKTKTGGSYEFEYTTLDYMIEHVRLALTSKGLWFTQTLEQTDNKYRLITTLMHKSGQWLASETPLMVADQSNQGFGSALTYMKRYALAAMLGIASDDDDDGNSADGHAVAERRERAPLPEAKPSTMAGRKVEADGVRAAREWVNSKAIPAIKACKTAEALNVWHEANAKTLAKLKAVLPDEHNALTDRIAVKADSFNVVAAG